MCVKDTLQFCVCVCVWLCVCVYCSSGLLKLRQTIYQVWNERLIAISPVLNGTDTHTLSTGLFISLSVHFPLSAFMSSPKVPSASLSVHLFIHSSARPSVQTVALFIHLSFHLSVSVQLLYLAVSRTVSYCFDRTVVIIAVAALCGSVKHLLYPCGLLISLRCTYLLFSVRYISRECRETTI